MRKTGRTVLSLLALAGLAFGAAAAPQTSPPEAALGYLSTGRVCIVSSSHQDTAWMDTPAACRQFRIEHNILPALEMMRKDPNYTFCMEGTLHAMEFLEAHPELRGELIQRMKEGRLEFGATYNQPYESWLSGEELVRETYFGRRWIQKNLPGCDARVAFNPDPPGRAWQMQQILAKAGIPYMFISRYHEGLYRWESPDGSSVLMYSPGHYGNDLPLLNGQPAQCVAKIRAKLQQQSPYYQQRHIPPVCCLINSIDFSQPVDFRALISAWNAQPEPRPTMGYSSMRGFFEAIDKPAAHFDTLLGERPDVWSYITGPTHHWTASARREAARLLPAAETFTTFACLLKGNFGSWPASEFNTAWLDEIYMDHGIGGNNGHITDEVFYRKIRNARDTGRRLLARALGSIAGRVRTNPKLGLPVLVFNTLSWRRSGPVEVDLSGTVTPPVRVVDAAGKEVPSQVTTLDQPDELNVAAAAHGARATASSAFSPDYGPGKAIDGKWAVRDPDPALGPSDKWNSARGATGPHWLIIDFGRPRTIHKVVIRHEGVIGAFDGETKYNTADFQIQSSDSAAGPWTDLVPPVVHNTASLTVHTFAPKSTRYLRLLITKGAAADGFARIYEVQAFEAVAPKPKLLFAAEGIPPLGYKTFYLVGGAAAAPAKAARSGRQSSAERCENRFYRVGLAPGGIKSLFDKQQKRELLATGKFLGGEVFTMLSVAPDPGVRAKGTDAGEFGATTLPVMDDTFDRVANHRPQWKLREDGPVRTVCELEQPLGGATVRQRMVLWHPFKRIDCEVELKDFDGALWREFRMALPLALAKPQLACEVPMGVIQIGKDEVPTTGGHAYGSLDYFQQCREIHPREVQDFVDASDGRGGLTMSSDVSVFDWQDPTPSPAAYPILQPVLLATRKSCNGRGNWYPQPGDHIYRFALTTHEGGWRNGYRPGIAANHPLQAVVNPSPGAGASLPPELGFASVSAGNVLISTVKKCEDDDSVVARVYEIEGKDSPVALKLFKPVLRAEKTSLLEEGGRPLPVAHGSVQLRVGHHAIETLKLRVKSGAQGGM